MLLSFEAYASFLYLEMWCQSLVFNLTRICMRVSQGDPGCGIFEHMQHI